MAHSRYYIAGYPTDATLVRFCLDEVKPDANAPRLKISPTQHCIDRHRWNGRLKLALRRFWSGSPLLVDAVSSIIDVISSIVDAVLVQAPDAIPFPAITLLPTAGFLLLPGITLLCKATTPKPSNKRVRGVKPNTPSSPTSTKTITPSPSNYNLRHCHPSQTATVTLDRPNQPEARIRPSSSPKSTMAMPRKQRPSKTVISTGNLKEKANSSSHTAPLASTSNPASAPATAKSSEQDVEMNVQHLLSSNRPRNEATDPTSGLSTSDHGANDELQDDEQDNRSNSEIDDPDLVKEHDGGMHVDFGDELDPKQASLHDKDDDDNNMDESEIAALRACEALFGSDRASTTARGVGGGSGGALAAMGISGLRGLGGIMAGFTLNSRISFNPSSTSRLAALQELAKILAVSTEDTLAGYFQTDSFARELVAILRGESERTKCEDEEDEVALVAALTATGSSSSSFNHPSSGTDVEQISLHKITVNQFHRFGGAIAKYP
ncbi:hypothetical protein PCASD_25161 [Puccinia coronata f. sp. avenae]|uniref:Uncharacterized protein n=1 Tax=Puccinia coronata f. sp. avenae TaxID=200324 RepID=A0A2N5THX2_9BASI|nr:hypothetical protein PCASD_25161 [Puccinia coronata f. sp. avenae]